MLDMYRRPLCKMGRVGVDQQDAHSAGFIAGRPASSEPSRLRRFEEAAMTLVVNEKAAVRLSTSWHLRARFSSWRTESISRRSHRLPDRRNQHRSFSAGVMNYAPNVEGAVWLAREVWPIVRSARPDARLTLIGASPSAEVVALASDRTGVVVTGTVPDVRPYLWRAAVAAAPLQIARGIQNKVLEAVAAGLPCVVTPQVAEGLPREVVPACWTGSTVTSSLRR